MLTEYAVFRTPRGGFWSLPTSGRTALKRGVPPEPATTSGNAEQAANLLGAGGGICLAGSRSTSFVRVDGTLGGFLCRRGELHPASGEGVAPWDWGAPPNFSRFFVDYPCKNGGIWYFYPIERVIVGRTHRDGCARPSEEGDMRARVSLFSVCRCV